MRTHTHTQSFYCQLMLKHAWDTISGFTHMIKETSLTHETHVPANITQPHTPFWSIYLMEMGLDVAPVITEKWFVALSLPRSHCPQ